MAGFIDVSSNATVRASTFTRYVGDHADKIIYSPLRILLVIVLALVARALLHRAIDRLTTTTSADLVPQVLRPLRERAAVASSLLEAHNLLSERRRQRADTIGSVLKNGVSFAIFVIAFMEILRELNFDLTPLIAGTSIIGVALGFGAQNIVKDFLAGMFMILEDQYGVGDVIDLKDATGTVEAVGLRTTRLRDVHGTVWYMRNGEIVRVGNQSQGFAQVVLDLPIAAATDLRAASAALLAVAQELHADPQWAPNFLAEPELLGVEEMDRDQTVLRLVARVRPLQQWAVARELRERVRLRFDELGLPHGAAPATEDAS